jgi:hypothetical protein
MGMDMSFAQGCLAIMGKGRAMCTIKPASRSKHVQVLPVIWMRLCDTEIKQIADAVCSS